MYEAGVDSSTEPSYGYAFRSFADVGAELIFFFFYLYLYCRAERKHVPIKSSLSSVFPQLLQLDCGMAVAYFTLIQKLQLRPPSSNMHTCRTDGRDNCILA
jgi:hypothetical protein